MDIGPQVAAHLGYQTMPQACEAGVAWACGVGRIYPSGPDSTPESVLIIVYTAGWVGAADAAPDVAGDPAGLAEAILPQLPDDVQSVMVSRTYIDTWRDGGVTITHTYAGTADRGTADREGQ